MNSKRANTSKGRKRQNKTKAFDEKDLNNISENLSQSRTT